MSTTTRESYVAFVSQRLHPDDKNKAEIAEAVRLLNYWQYLGVKNWRESYPEDVMGFDEQASIWLSLDLASLWDVEAEYRDKQTPKDRAVRLYGNSNPTA